MVTFTPTKLAKILGIKPLSVYLSIIHHYLKELAEEGLIEPFPQRNRCRYVIRRGSPLWKAT
ncbi:MAG: hypothetical protein DRN15_05205 [Thermoprotei archaeon]|nr:MAG: hypothetical protein DRN15_05205 [Thermoprotei archaeon]RLF24639.1 MAG: hypothetical protein DRM97_03185 [Thermoprotei archaeon]